MRPYSRYFLAAALACGLPLGCNNSPPGSTDSYVRLHYRLQTNGNPRDWGVYFYGAGATSPDFVNSPKFDQTDDFGAYYDIKITATGTTNDDFLGLIPLLCTGGNCRKDIETQVRWSDLPAVQGNANIHECWITQGQAVQLVRPVAGQPQYRIFRPSEFIDLGDGRVRLMFRVPRGSTGTVSYGTSQTTLNQQVTWTATNDINTNGLIVSGLTAGTPIYYRINSSLQSGGQTYTDQSAIQQLTPIAFTPVTMQNNWADWGRNGLMYEVFVRTFADGGGTRTVTDGTTQSGIDPATRDGIGDLVGLRSTLPYLKGLGVNAIWMTPVFRAKSYHGYDTTNFYDIDPAVGTIRDFVELTTAAHALGIRILVDFVINHVADVNPWFIAALDPTNADYAKYRDWFVYSDDYENLLTDPHPFDPNGVIWACRRYVCYHQIFGASIPELNFRNPAVRTEMKNIAKFWLERGADGFRLDASKHIDQFDDNNEIAVGIHGTHVWWKEFNEYVKNQVTRTGGLGQVILAGENRWDDPALYRNMVPYGADMDSQFDFPFRTVLSNFLTTQNADASVDFVAYYNQLQAAAAVSADGGNTNHYFERFLSNHDLTRPATQFAEPAATRLARLKLAATIVFSVPGLPVIYYGEEFGKEGDRAKFLGNEPYDHDEFIREPMSWFENLTFTGNRTASYDIDYAMTNSANASLNLGAGVCTAPNPDYRFIKYMPETDVNSWAAQKADPNSLYNYYKKLVTIRQANPVITDLNTTLTTRTNTASLYEFTLDNGVAQLRVVLNRQNSDQMVTRPAAMTDLLSGTTASQFTVPPYGALILSPPAP